MKALLPLLLTALAAAPAAAQRLPVLPTNPAALRWQQLRTPHFRLLYPLGLDSAARRTAGRLEALHEPEGTSLGVRARPLTVVLQNQTTVANGFVTFLPRHAEFFTTPDQGQGLGTVDWLDGLVVHESRHVNQFDKARQGFGRVLVPLLGEGGLGVSALGVPQWFFEGDAVGTETAFTRSGRGRIPAFGLGLRANLLSGRRDSYQKAVNGSLRDNVPNWYVLGYYLTTYAKVRYGPGVWARALDGYYRFPFYPFSFSRGLRRATGLRVEDLYARTIAELDSGWRAQAAARPAPTPARELAGQVGTRVFTQYQYPQYVDDSTVLALKSGLGDIPRLVLLGRRGSAKQPERRVFTLGPANIPEQLSVGGGRVVWPEFRQSRRWGQRVFSELHLLDLRTRRHWRVGRGGRYAAASLSPDGQRLVAVRTDEAYHHALVVLDANSGAVLREIPNPRNDFYQQPRWLADGRRVVAVALSAAGKTLRVLSPEGRQADLLPVANVNLSNPQPWGRFVLYNSPQTGADNVFAVDTASGQTYQVSRRPLGGYHAAVAPGGRALALHDYRATGARVVEIPLDVATWLPLPTPATTDAPEPLVAGLVAGEPAAARVAALLAQPAPVGGPAGSGTSGSGAPLAGARHYRPLLPAPRVFSYGVVQSPDGASVSVGLRAQDYLNTTQLFAGLGYDQTERTLAATGAVSYQGLPLVLDAEGSYGGRNSRIVDQAGRVYSGSWQAANLLAGVRLPLVLTQSKYLRALTLSTYYLNEQVFNYPLPLRRRSEVGPNAPLHALQTSVGYASQLRQSARDVAPRWGGSLLATYRVTPFGTALQASQVGVQMAAFLPGLGRHHALRLRGGFQYQDQSQYNFTAAISYPRAETSYLSLDRLWVGSADYSLPLAFPHWSLGRVLYVQRLRATAFVDAAAGSSLIPVRGPGGTPQNVRFKTDFQNVGVDVLALFNVLRLRTPIEAGVRVAWTSAREWLVQPLAFSVRL